MLRKILNIIKSQIHSNKEGEKKIVVQERFESQHTINPRNLQSGNPIFNHS